ncbi:hypothetical protein BLNAU_9156 [Blattamonas nauphoetae]|uniref:Uncharacterized protein n=1 Tax=Blattamonas nauphoetae TaxID=2049346 RepID=A0ABQ9XWH4_9EUKA|nr:hypothetical protein BLNAU_9156 [Blattamonas nauphoetae]
MSNLFGRPQPERLPVLPNVSAIIDATVVQIDKPIIRSNPVDSTFSGKHHFHCFKWTVGVTPVTGTATMPSKPVEGAIHDWVDENMAQSPSKMAAMNKINIKEPWFNGKWPFRRAKLPAVFSLCVCVTKHHISQNPLTKGEDRIEQAASDNALLNFIEATEATRASNRRYREKLPRRE